MLSITSLPLSMVSIPAPKSLSNSSQTITSSKNISLRNHRKLGHFKHSSLSDISCGVTPTPINPIDEFSAWKSLRTPHPAFPTLTQHARSTQQVHVGQKVVSENAAATNMYSVWAVPPEEVRKNLKELMKKLRSDYGGPEFEPHFTVVGPSEQLETDAIQMFRAACKGVKPYTATVDYIVPGPSYYESVYCCLQPSDEVVDTAAHCSKYFGGGIRNQYMLHVSLLFGDFTYEKKQKIKERAEALYPELIGLSFPVSKYLLYRTNTDDPTLESWGEVDSCNLIG